MYQDMYRYPTKRRSGTPRRAGTSDVKDIELMQEGSRAGEEVVLCWVDALSPITPHSGLMIALGSLTCPRMGALAKVLIEIGSRGAIDTETMMAMLPERCAGP